MAVQRRWGKPLGFAAWDHTGPRIGKTAVRQPEEFTKRQLYDMLAEAVRNTGSLDQMIE